MTFCSNSWCSRLSEAVQLLNEVQGSFLEAYWERNGRPTIITFNGQDETPFPTDDLLSVYDASLCATRDREVKYYKKLRAALDPVRGVLRSHPALGRALGHRAGNDKFMIEITTGSTLTWLSQLVVGLMQRASCFSDRGIEHATDELAALLDASLAATSVEIPRNLDLGYDVVLFAGPEIKETIELKPDLAIVPFSSLEAWIEPSWLRDYLPQHVEYRDWRQIGAVVRSFRWKPRVRPMNHPSNRMLPPRPRFDLEAFTFLELLAVSGQSPIVPFLLLNDCIHQAAFSLLGTMQGPGNRQHIGFINWRHDPFRKPPVIQGHAIHQAVRAFEHRHSATFQRLELVRRRLSEALARTGRFALDDRIVDVSQSIELMLEIRTNNVGKRFVSGLADLLSSDEEHNAAIRKAAKKFYDVRSAIVHGPSDDYRKRLMQERVSVFRSGFHLAQELYFRLIFESVQ